MKEKKRREKAEKKRKREAELQRIADKMAAMQARQAALEADNESLSD